MSGARVPILISLPLRAAEKLEAALCGPAEDDADIWAFLVVLVAHTNKTRLEIAKLPVEAR